MPFHVLVAFPLLHCLVVLAMLSAAHLQPTLAFASFVFGDSLVDVGNNNFLFTLSKANSPPYGIDFAASGGQPTGRFTNGRTITDIIGQALGARSFPPPFLGLNGSSDKLLDGVNYASGASGILDATGSLFIERVPLGRQIRYFQETRDHMVQIYGMNFTEELLKKAIFSITTGSNDILNYLEPFLPSIGKKNLPPAVLHDIMISNLTLHLKRLHELGARKLVVVGVGPLGCTPYIRALNFMADGRCSPAANKLVRGYNVKLRRMINQLSLETDPETIFIYANSYKIVTEIVQNYGQYGFENANYPCCSNSFFPFLCFSGQNNNSSTVLCKDRAKYVFWDAYHPTEATNIIIANKLLDGDTSAASPINLRKLYDILI